MGNTVYRDLAAFGLPLVTPTQPEFTSLVHDIQSRPGPFGSWPIDDLSNAAVLLNETGSAILSISYSWRYTTAGGGVHSSHCSNLGSSSIQLDVLSGRSQVVQDIGTFILPGSKRLITERGMFGNNLDVLGQDPRPHGGGYGGAAGGGTRNATSEKIVAGELILDLAILDDGRCVGPDEYGVFEASSRILKASVVRQSRPQSRYETATRRARFSRYFGHWPAKRHTPQCSGGGRPSFVCLPTWAFVSSSMTIRRL